jgi:nitroreductase
VTHAESFPRTSPAEASIADSIMDSSSWRTTTVDTDTVEEVLATTRTVRRRLDLTRPVARELVEESLRLALQAPSGGDRQEWYFLLIDDDEIKRRIAPYYRKAFDAHWITNRPTPPHARILASARFLADHLHEVPVLVLACLRRRLPADPPLAQQSSFFGSIYPAVWSFMLAARSKNLATALTTAHLNYEREIAGLLAIPFDTVTQAALIAVGHPKDTDFRRAPRKPLTDVASWNGWPG